MDNLRPGWTALLLIVIFTSNQASAADTRRSAPGNSSEAIRVGGMEH